MIRHEWDPLGYGWDVDASATVIVDSEAEAVKAAFTIAAEGVASASGVARELKRRGIKRGRKVKGKDGYITGATIKRIIRNPAYRTGDWTPQPNSLPDYVVRIPPLIGQEVWEAANRAIDRAPKFPKRKMSEDYLLRGLVRCACCGGPARGHTVTSHGGKYSYQYYRCAQIGRPPLNKAPCGSRGALRTDRVDSLVWAHIAHLIREPGALRAEVERMVEEGMADAVKPEAALRKLDGELRNLDEERSRLVRGFRKGLFREDELEKELQDIERQRAPLFQRRDLVLLKRKGLQDQQARLEATEAKLAAMKDTLDDLNFAERRAVIKELVERITIDTAEGTIELRTILLQASESEAGEGSGGRGGTGGNRPPGGSSRRGPFSYGSDQASRRFSLPEPETPLCIATRRAAALQHPEPGWFPMQLSAPLPEA